MDFSKLSQDQIDAIVKQDKEQKEAQRQANYAAGGECIKLAQEAKADIKKALSKLAKLRKSHDLSARTDAAILRELLDMPTPEYK